MATLLLFLCWMPARWCYHYTWYWNYFSLQLFRYILGIRYQVYGLENIKDLKKAIVVANHESSWETQALTVLLPPLAWVIKRELIFIPFFGWVIFLMRPIMLRRTKKISALAKMIELGKKSLQNGRWVAIFPQGNPPSQCP